MKKTLAVVTSIASVLVLSTLAFFAKYRSTTTLTQAELKPAAFAKRMAPPAGWAWSPSEDYSGLYRAIEAASLERPKRRTTPLSEDEVAIYHALLEQWVGRGSLNVAFRSEPLDVNSYGAIRAECLKEIDVQSAADASHSFHVLPRTILSGKRMRLVDPEEHAITDPEVSMRRGESVERAVDTAYDAGLFSVSEIAFDKQRTRALLSYSFHCGSLCGSGRSVIFKKVERKWKKTDRICGGWIS